MDSITAVVLHRLKAWTSLFWQLIQNGSVTVMWEVALQAEISTFKRHQAAPVKFLRTGSQGLPAQANVRVLPSTGFAKLSDMVADAEHVQDARETQVRSRVLEMQSRLMEDRPLSVRSACSRA
ncbi:unnamed protein product [Symbiodinium sp. CCMP2456]|nr:unnamed protein product [Symbiodinium sp. CCMP2456]